MAVRASKLNVLGRVQRVGYRRFVLDTAQELGVAGYVRNEGDGSVAIFAQGDEVKLKEFLEKTRSPPSPAQVREMKELPAKADPRLTRFSIKFGTVQEELQEGFGAVQTEFQDYRGEFRDYREEFRDFAKRTDENFKTLGDRYGEISEKLTKILETLIAESAQTRQALNETMTLLREAVERISQKG